MAIAFAGVDRIVAGSDYPHQIGSLELMKQSIASLAISERDKNKIRSENAARILQL
jgi:aminocarboxymuconate-semialdehyde decarboxylase